jgi:hypothetical protein
VTIAAILLVLLSLTNFPWLYLFLFPGAEEPPAFFLYLGYVVGVVGIVAAVGLWMMKKQSLWATIIVSVLNILLNVSGLAMVPSGALQAAIVVQTVGFVLIIVLLVPPSARRAMAAP